MDKKRALMLAESLKELRQPWNAHFRELERFFNPRKGLFASNNDPSSYARSRRGDDRINRDLLDTTPLRALRVLKSGMQSGMTSPSRPWFRWQADDPAIRDKPKVKEFVSTATNMAMAMFQRSGLYQTLHSQYGHLGQFGTSAMLLEDDPGYGVRPFLFKPGSFWINSSAGRLVDTLYRETNMTVEQIVGKFVYKNGPYRAPDWTVVPSNIKNLYDKGDTGKQFTVKHLITPRVADEIDPQRMDAAGKPFASTYWMDDHASSDKLQMMGQFGYDRNRLICPRWEADEYDPWGMSPAMDALPEAKELMAKRRDYAELLRRLNRPTMNAAIELRNSAFSLMPGAVNFMADPTKGMRPSFEVSANFAPLREDIAASKKEIWSLLYADLFLLISSMDRPDNSTATVANLMQSEKMMEVGPVVERLQTEQDAPILDIVFDVIMRSGKIGPPPEELQGSKLKVDFISILAQAQKAVATGAIERLWSFGGNIAAMKPGVLDRLDEDATIEEYADVLGVPPSVLRDDAAVATIRTQRQQAAAQQQQTNNALPMAQAANQGAQALQTAQSVIAPSAAGAQASQVLSQADQGGGTPAIDTLRRLGLA